MLSRSLLLAVTIAWTLAAWGCGDGGGSNADAGPTADASEASDGSVGPDSGPTGPELEFLSRIFLATNPDWCGDELVYQKRRFTNCSEPFCSDVYRINPFDPSPEEVCLTCGITGLAGTQHKGDPDWHPSCDYVLFTATNSFATGLIEEDPSFAINSDLWIVGRDGSDASAQSIVPHAQSGRAALHPHFSPGGDYIYWSDRIEPTDTTYCVGLGRQTPGCTNPWRGWFLGVAKLQMSGGTFSLDGAPVFFGDGEVDPDLRGMYEPGEIYQTGTELILYYSLTRCGQNGDLSTVCGYEYMGQDMMMPFETTLMTYGQPVKILGVDGQWSEKLQDVGDGVHRSVSSSAHSSWNFFNPGDGFANLSLEVHLAVFGSTEQVRLTHFNEPDQLASFATERGYISCNRALASDHAWSADGANFATNATYTCTSAAGPVAPPTLVIYRNLGAGP